MFGYDKHDLLGRPVTELLSEPKGSSDGTIIQRSVEFSKSTAASNRLVLNVLVGFLREAMYMRGLLSRSDVRPCATPQVHGAAGLGRK